MNKEKFIKSTIILIIGGLITKILGMVIKVINTRLIGLEGIGLYMLIMPTFSLFMSLAQLSLPVSISKLVSEDKYNNKNLIFSSIPIIIVFDILLIFIIILLADFISIDLLKDSRCYLPIICIGLVLPFEALSNMLRGYFFGKQKMFPHVVSHVIEQLVRLTATIILVPTLLKIDLVYAVAFLVLVNMLSEFTSIIVLLLFMPKNIKIKKEDIKPNPDNIKNILDISIPNTSTRVVGNIGYFLEPILLTSGMLIAGYSSTYIVQEYGIVSGYSMPLLLLPSFFTGAISNSLLPVISKAYADKNYSYIKRKLKQAITISLSIGLPVTIILFLFPQVFLNLLYGTTHGGNYLKALAFPFLFYYIELPLASCLQAMDKSKNVMIDNIIGITLKTILIYILSLCRIGMYSFVIASSVNIIYVTISHYFNIKKRLKSNRMSSIIA